LKFSSSLTPQGSKLSNRKKEGRTKPNPPKPPLRKVTLSIQETKQEARKKGDEPERRIAFLSNHYWIQRPIKNPVLCRAGLGEAIERILS
jgi:hypothetical protein